MRTLCAFGFKVAFAVTLLALQAVHAKSYGVSGTSGAAPALQSATDTLALMFERNQGQADPRVHFLSRGLGDQVFLTAQEAVVLLDPGRTAAPRLRPSVLRLRFDGARSDAEVEGLDPVETVTNYFIGGPAEHITNVGNYAKVRYRAIYPGIDLLYYRNQRALEFDLVVAAGANPDRIAFRLLADGKVSLRGGELHMATPAGELIYRKPVAYQLAGSVRTEVPARYRVMADGSIRFKLGSYDKSKALVIDPILSYSSFLYGHSVAGVAVDSSGAAYIAGTTTVADLPTVGGYRTTLNGTQDAYLVKVDPSGSKLLYASYLGVRRANTSATGVALDSGGNAYVIGQTDSASFPVTTGAYQTTGSGSTSFVTKFNAAGNALVYSTYLNWATPRSIRVDASGNAYMTGHAYGLSATPGAFQNRGYGPTPPFVAKLNAAGSAMAYVTYLGGTGTDRATGLAVDAQGNAYLVGVAGSTDFPTLNAYQAKLRGTSDGFLAKLNATGSALVYSTYLGGSGADSSNAVAVDSQGHAYVAGSSHSNDFPVTAAAFQRFKAHADEDVSNATITKFSSDGSALQYSSYLGGRWCLTAGVYSCTGLSSQDIDAGTAVAVDAAGYAYLGGFATSVEFPLVDPIHAMSKQGDEWRAPFVAKITPKGDRLVYSAVMGVRAQDEQLSGLAVDAKGAVYAVGNNGWAMSEYPITAAPARTTGGTFIFKFSTGKYPTTLTGTPSPATASQPVTLTATVLNTATGGTVTFSNGGVAIGTAPVAQGVATLTTTLPAGAHKLTAHYSVDGVVSPILILTVNPE